MKSLIKKAYRPIKSLYLKQVRFKHLKVGLDCKKHWYGNQYGGFYLSPDLLDKQSIVYSVGIGEDISFDQDLIDTHGCSVFGFDPTPKSINWCKQQDLPSGFSLYEYGLGAKTEKVQFHLPKNTDHVSGSIHHHDSLAESNSVEVSLRSFNDIALSLGHEKIDVLKMDIEGSEYDVIEGILSSAVVIDQLAIELHERFFEDGQARSRQLVRAIKDAGYELFAVSESYEEVSFIRTAAIQGR